MNAVFPRPLSHRYLVLRRMTQVGLLALFWLAAHRGVRILNGNLSAAELFDTVPLLDPFALLQVLCTGRWVPATALLGAGIVIVVYAVLGRVFCPWVCPVNPVTDLAGYLRRRLDLPKKLRLARSTRYWALGLSLVVSSATGVAAFEWISPIGMLHRELIFGLGLGAMAAIAVFLFDLFGPQGGWCGSLCPLGAFYSIVGFAPRLRVKFAPSRCDRCLDCVAVCPEPQVINFAALTREGHMRSGECTNCLRCVEVCPTRAFTPALRRRWNAPTLEEGGRSHE